MSKWKKKETQKMSGVFAGLEDEQTLSARDRPRETQGSLVLHGGKGVKAGKLLQRESKPWERQMTGYGGRV